MHLNKNSAQGTIDEPFGKRFAKKSIAQGTIEYLVIIAVVVVISLVVVGLFIGVFSNSSQQVINSSSKIGNNSAGGISIVEGVIDSQGDALIRLNNTSSDAITLTRISVGGVDNNYLNQIVGLDSKTISLSGLANACPCVGGQKSVTCEYIVNYIQNGITKTVRLNKTTECVSDAVAVDEGKVIDPIDGSAPSVLLLSPSDRNVYSGRNIYFDFNSTDNSTISSCTLRIGSDTNTYYNLNNGLNTILYTKSGNDGAFDWNISCTNGTNSSTSTSRQIFMDANSQQIGSCIELQDMNKNLSGNYELMNDVNCYTDTRVGGALYNGGAGFRPVGDSTIKFTGTFNGKNKIIYNMFINSLVGYTGLFGYVNSGTIYDVGLVNVNVTGTSGLVGGLVGWLFSGDINNSYSTGTVTGSGSVSDVGGLAGQSGGTISNSYSTGTVTGSSNVGGLVGLVSGPMSYSYSTATVTGSGNYVGGLMGYNLYATISNSYSSGTVTGSGSGTSGVGGLAGGSTGVISNCYSTSNVIASGSIYVGGLVGNNSYVSGPISYSSSTGTVTGSTYVGGLVGNSSGLVSYSSSTGAVTGSGNYVGGLVGYSSKAITYSFSTGNVIGSGSSYVGGLVGQSINESISNSYSTGNVTGSGNYVGGLVGQVNYTTIQSYSTGAVTGSSNVGGLVGRALNSMGGEAISNSYSTGLVTGSGSNLGGLVGNLQLGTITNSYWDINRTGKTVCCGAGTCTNCVGKNLANSDPNAFFSNVIGLDYNVPMQHNSVPANDWNFVINWKKVDNNYPKLFWQ